MEHSDIVIWACAERLGIAETLGLRGEIEARRQVEAQARDRGGAGKQSVYFWNVTRAEDPTASRHDGQTLQGRKEERLDLATEHGQEAPHVRRVATGFGPRVGRLGQRARSVASLQAGSRPKRQTL